MPLWQLCGGSEIGAYLIQYHGLLDLEYNLSFKASTSEYQTLKNRIKEILSNSTWVDCETLYADFSAQGLCRCLVEGCDGNMDCVAEFFALTAINAAHESSAKWRYFGTCKGFLNDKDGLVKIIIERF